MLKRKYKYFIIMAIAINLMVPYMLSKDVKASNMENIAVTKNINKSDIENKDMKNNKIIDNSTVLKNDFNQELVELIKQIDKIKDDSDKSKEKSLQIYEKISSYKNNNRKLENNEVLKKRRDVCNVFYLNFEKKIYQNEKNINQTNKVIDTQGYSEEIVKQKINEYKQKIEELKKELISNDNMREELIKNLNDIIDENNNKRVEYNKLEEKEKEIKKNIDNLISNFKDSKKFEYKNIDKDVDNIYVELDEITNKKNNIRNYEFLEYDLNNLICRNSTEINKYKDTKKKEILDITREKIQISRLEYSKMKNEIKNFTDKNRGYKYQFLQEFRMGEALITKINRNIRGFYKSEAENFMGRLYKLKLDYDRFKTLSYDLNCKAIEFRNVIDSEAGYIRDNFDYNKISELRSQLDEFTKGTSIYQEEVEQFWVSYDGISKEINDIFDLKVEIDENDPMVKEIKKEIEEENEYIKKLPSMAEEINKSDEFEQEDIFDFIISIYDYGENQKKEMEFYYNKIKFDFNRNAIIYLHKWYLVNEEPSKLYRKYMELIAKKVTDKNINLSNEKLIKQRYDLGEYAVEMQRLCKKVEARYIEIKTLCKNEKTKLKREQYLSIIDKLNDIKEKIGDHYRYGDYIMNMLGESYPNFKEIISAQDFDDYSRVCMYFEFYEKKRILDKRIMNNIELKNQLEDIKKCIKM